MVVVAYSYRRFSSRRQGKGTSIARQSEQIGALCEREGWVLDTTLRMSDEGVSAFRGKNADLGCLGEFRRLVKDGTVRPGSVLICENLDRISRADIDAGSEIVHGILRAGVNIYVTKSNRLYTPESLKDPFARMEIMFDLIRAHDESKRKSGFSRYTWDKRRKNIDKKILTKKVPGWLKAKPDHSGFDLIEDIVESIRLVFQWCIDGVGVRNISCRLAQEGRRLTETGKAINTGNIHNIITGRAVLGEFQPRILNDEGELVPFGDPIPDYFPRIIDDITWTRANVSLKQRGFAQGRRSKTTHNLFNRILFNARDGAPLVAIEKKRCKDGVPYIQLISCKMDQGRTGDNSYFGGKDVEAKILEHLKEIKVEDVFPDNSNTDRQRLKLLGDRLDEINAELKYLEEHATELGAQFYLKGVQKFVAQKNKVEEEYAELNAKCISPDGDCLRSLQDTLKECGFNPTDDEVRLKLRAAIARLVKGIWILRHGKFNAARFLVQVVYKNGEQRLIAWNVSDSGSVSLLQSQAAPILPLPDLREYRNGPDWFADPDWLFKGEWIK